MSRDARPLLQRRRFRWLLFFGLWTVIGLFDGLSSYGLVRVLGRHIGLDVLLGLSLAEWYIWAALAPLLGRVAQWFSLTEGHWPRRLVLLSVSCVVFAALKIGLDFPLELIFRLRYAHEMDTQSVWEFFQFIFLSRFTGNLFICSGILGGAHTLEYYRRYRWHEREASQLETELARAELQVLKMQLHPHFLFNTLNAVSALLHKDVDLADRMIARLGDLLRLSLENVGKHEVFLQQELEFLQLYLEIEQARLGPRLQLDFDIEPDIRDAIIPNLILQPLVENAVRHGIAPYSRPGRIEISARRLGNRLRLEVRDDGPGLPAGAFREGVGLSNTRARLMQLYGPAHRFEMTDAPGGGLSVTLTLPLRTEMNGDEPLTETPDEDSVLNRR